MEELLTYLMLYVEDTEFDKALYAVEGLSIKSKKMFGIVGELSQRVILGWEADPYPPQTKPVAGLESTSSRFASKMLEVKPEKCKLK